MANAGVCAGGGAREVLDQQEVRGHQAGALHRAKPDARFSHYYS